MSMNLYLQILETGPHYDFHELGALLPLRAPSSIKKILKITLTIGIKMNILILHIQIFSLT